MLVALPRKDQDLVVQVYVGCKTTWFSNLEIACRTATTTSIRWAKSHSRNRLERMMLQGRASGEVGCGRRWEVVESRTEDHG